MRQIVAVMRTNGGHFINHYGLFATEEFERWHGPGPTCRASCAAGVEAGLAHEPAWTRGGEDRPLDVGFGDHAQRARDAHGGLDRRVPERHEALRSRREEHSRRGQRPSLTVPAGKICVLVGPSGCGKTTSLKMVNRLIEPTSGQILIDGDIAKRDAIELRRSIGYVIQQVGLFPHQTIGDNVAKAAAARLAEAASASAPGSCSRLRADPAKYRDRFPSQLSGGERQRVGVARALAADPPIMLMDEPFGAVDLIVRERLQNEFLRLQEELAKTILFVTHDIDEAIKLGDLVAVMELGGHRPVRATIGDPRQPRVGASPGSSGLTAA